MTALLCSILCASLVNIGLAFAGRRGWDSRPVLLAAYLASALLAGALLASARPALCWPGPAAEYRPLFLFVLFSLCAAAQAAELARARVPLVPGPLVLGAPLGACSLLSSLFLKSALALAAVSLVLVNL